MRVFQQLPQIFLLLKILIFKLCNLEIVCITSSAEAEDAGF